MSSQFGCTIAAFYGDNNYYLGSNSDNPWAARTKMSIRTDYPHKFMGVQLVSPEENLPWANMITRGVNEKGIAFTFAFVDCSTEIKPEKGLGFKDFGTYILGNFSTLAEVRKYLEENKTLVHGNFFFVDEDSNLLVCELHPEQSHFKWNPDDKIIRTNHFFELPFYEEHDVSETNSIPRHESGLKAMKSLSPIDSMVEYLQSFLSSHFNEHQPSSWGNSTCNHGTKAGTVSSEIIDPKSKTIWYCYGPPCGKGNKMNGWGEYIPFSLESYSEEKDLTTINGQRLEGEI